MTGKAQLTLPTETQIKVVRDVDAPPHLVYEAWTNPELIKRWWSAKRGEVTVAEVDLCEGGKWRYAMITTEGGFEVAFHGEFREIVPNERIVSTEVYEGLPEGIDAEAAAAINTVTFEERDGGTLLTILMEHSSKKFRDMTIESGMEDGLQDALDLLEAISSDRG